MKHKAFILFLIIGVALLFSAGCKKNKGPETPDKPSGRAVVGKNAANEYTTKAHDPNDDEIRYIFDWGDNKIDTTPDYYPSGSVAKATHAWADTGQYAVKVRAQDKKGALSTKWSDPLLVTVVVNRPPDKPLTPFGPSIGQPNIKHTFKTVVTDPDGDSVRAKFDWGDGRTPSWTNYFKSGDTISDTITYTANDTGAKSIKVVAQDTKGDTSEWSNPYTFQVTTGAWSYIPGVGGEEFFSSPALITSGNAVTAIVVGCSDGFVYCLDTLGTLKWSYPDTAHYTGAAFNSSPAIGTDGTIYIGDDEGTLHAINPNGSRKWVFQVAGVYAFNSSPALDDARNVLYIGCENDTLYAINTTNGSRTWAYGARAEISSSPAIASDGAIIFGDEADTGRIYILNPDGSERHIFTAVGPIYSSPALSGGKIYFAAGDSFFYALDTNVVSCSTYLPSVGREEVYSSPSIGTNGVIYFGNNSGYLYALNPALSEIWAKDQGYEEIKSSVAIGTDGLLYFVSENDFLVATNATTGNPTWYHKLTVTKTKVKQEIEIKPSPVIGPNGWIYVASGDGIFAFNRNTQLANTAWPMFRHDIRHTGKASAKK